MGGYQQLVRGEPFRGKFRQSFEKPVPFVLNQPELIAFQLPDVAHTFRAGHRIMVQVQSSWFPLTDRNPQTFGDIPNAKPIRLCQSDSATLFRRPGWVANSADVIALVWWLQASSY